jgi:hypothetical protein
MRPFFPLRLLLFRITLIVSNLRLCEQFCIILCKVFGFSPLVLTIFRKEEVLFVDSKKCVLNHKKNWFKPKNNNVFLFFFQKNTKNLA